MRALRTTVRRVAVTLTVLGGAGGAGLATAVTTPLHASAAVTAGAGTVSAASAATSGNTYPWKTASPNGISPLRFYYRYCTDFVAWKLNEAQGVTKAPWKFTWSTLAFPGGNGNAVGWKQGAINSGYAVNTSPAIGSVAWWGSEVGGGLGHVAYVTAVNSNGTVDVAEYNYDAANQYDVRDGVKADAYLHVADLSTSSSAASLPPPVAGPWTITSTRRNGQPGYWETDSKGTTYPFGSAPSVGSVSGHLNAPIVSMITDPADSAGYWLLGADGGVFTFGGAPFYGSTGNRRIPARIVAMAATPSGKGYWLVGADGSVYPFGDARSYGSMGGRHLNKPVVGIARTPSGRGYRLVASDGGVFTFGDASFLGSMGGKHLNKPIIGLTEDPSTGGYRMVASDGGVFDFKATFYGSLGGKALAAPIYSMAPSTDGKGYYLVDTRGHVSAFGDAPFLGDSGL